MQLIIYCGNVFADLARVALRFERYTISLSRTATAKTSEAIQQKSLFLNEALDLAHEGGLLRRFFTFYTSFNTRHLS